MSELQQRSFPGKVAIGRFVQSFELMVHATRQSARMGLSATPQHQRLVNIVLHPNAMTAWPLFEIARAVYGEIVMQATFPKEQAEIVKGVLKQVADEYSALLSQRNVMMHGTWRIGWAAVDQEDFSLLNLNKFKTTKAGLAEVDTPDDVETLRALTRRCDENAALVELLSVCFLDPAAPRVNANFHRNERGSLGAKDGDVT